jgi:enamine deaminase RidA (YjgF/YER057c/UK114 family)
VKTKVFSIEEKLTGLGISIPNPPKPAGNYLLLNRVGNVVYISGVTCKFNGQLFYEGQVGKDITVEAGYEAAKITTLNHLAIIKEYLGDLDKIDRIIKVTGYVNCESGFPDIPKVMNGCSDLLIELFGEKGKHARCAVGVSSLPGNAAVESDMVVLLAE